jgi:glycosyltransferase involved in cell wall biosynthesis
MENPKFTVITPTFNPGHKLRETASSVLKQFSSLEYLVLDGGSVDDSTRLAEELASVDPRVRFKSEPDRGVYDAMNKGIRAARGRYLYFLGAGDVLLPGVLEKVAAQLPKDDRSLVYGNTEWNGKQYDGKFHPRKLFEKNLCHQAAFYGREIFDLVGLYDENYRLCADWDLNFRCFADPRIRKKYIPICVATYEPGGISTPGDERFGRDKLELYCRYFGPLDRWKVQGPKHWQRIIRGVGRRIGFKID